MRRTAAASSSAYAAYAERESLKYGAAVGVTAGEYVLIEVEDTGVGMTPG